MAADDEPGPRGASTAAGDTAPERIDRALTRAILRGDYEPGTHLPTVRELAADFGVNPSTIQRALARLESRGLVTARQGSGLTVNDPLEVGDLSLIPDWLTALADDPDRSASILADVLDLRRAIVSRHLARHREVVVTVIDELLAGAAALATASVEERWRGESAIIRAVLAETGNVAFLAVQNTYDRALEQLPDLVEALFGDAERTTTAVMGVMEALHEGGPDLAERIEATLAAADEHTVEAYRRLLADRQGLTPD